MGLPSRPLRALVLLAWAAFFLTLWVGGEADRYLGPRTTWVVPFGAVTLLLAAAGYGWLAVRRPSLRPMSGIEGVGFFTLLVPILAVLVVPRAELGAQAARKKDSNRTIAAAEMTKARRDAAKAAARAATEKGEVSKLDFLSVASVTTDPAYAQHVGIKPGMRIRTLGFVVGSGQPNHFRLTRFLISCCAADAVPAFINVNTAGAPVPSDNQWVQVTGALVLDQGRYVVRAEELAPAQRPADPYLTFWG